MSDSYEITPQIANEAIETLTTLIDYLRFAVSSFEAADCFYGHGTDNAWDEAVALIMPTLHLPMDVNQAVIHATLTRTEREAVMNAIMTRVNEELPVPYITNTAYFYGLPFYVDERVIIPRSPIAELISNEFEPWFEDREPDAILDMCTGSGCIAIACAMQFEDAEIDAVDISPDALAVAVENCELYDVSDRVTLIQSNLFENVPAKRYDLIIANPPYVPESSLSELPQEFLYEPELALVAGKDGLSCIKPFLKAAKQYLKPDGLLILEMGEAQLYFEEAYPDLHVRWLEFENGGEGVCAITAECL